MSDTIICEVSPKSERQLCQYARYTRKQFHIKDDYVDILSIMEKIPKILPNFEYRIVNDEDTDINMDGMMAYTEGYDGNILMVIREDIYDDAALGLGMQRLTIAHEIAHVLLKHCNGNAVFKRIDHFSYLRSKLKKEVDPEWQADVLAAELLAPRNLVKGMNVYEIMQKFKVSHTCAEVQKSKSKEK